MWIVLPLIFFMSWRFCRRIGQAFNETAAWTLGYLITSGIILLLDVGGTDLFAATPTHPIAVVPLLAGFVGMIISHYRWKRRGGHLEPRRGLFSADSKWLRAGRAMAGSSKANTSTSTRPTSQPTPPTPPAQGRAATTTATPTRPAQARKPAPKRPANKWARVLDAMLDADDNKAQPRR